MTLAVRDFSMVGQFAKRALTVVPPNPISGQAYRNPNVGQSEVESGQPYNQIGASAFWNQLLFMATGMAGLSEAFGFIPWSPFTNYTGEASWCLGSDGIPYRAKADSGPGTALMPGVGPKTPPNDDYWQTLADYVKNGGSGGGGGGGGDVVQGGFVVGDIALKSFRSGDLPAGWYFCNGGRYAMNTPQQIALANLSAAYQSDWGITTTSSGTNVPTLFSGSDGYFLRAVNGITRQVGSKQDDAIRAMSGSFGSIQFNGVGNFSGSFSAGAERAGYTSDGNNMWLYAQQTKFIPNVPTASENRPMNIGMTPAIYLGV